MAWARRREYFKGQGEGNAPTASKLYQVCHADTVLRFYFGELGADVSHSCVFGPGAFACEDQRAIAAIIEAVVERCSDGLAVAELECGIVEMIWTHRARLLHCPLVRNRGVSSLEISDQTAGHEARGDSVSDIDRLILEKDGM